MGCIQLNEKLAWDVLTAKQFYDESRWILQMRGRCRRWRPKDWKTLEQLYPPLSSRSDTDEAK